MITLHTELSLANINLFTRASISLIMYVFQCDIKRERELIIYPTHALFCLLICVSRQEISS